jgi:excisionase family DNA binding protein
MSGVPKLALNADEAAFSLGVTRSRIYDLINKGELAAVRDGRRSLIAVSEIERWLRSRRRAGRSPDPAPTIEARG